MVNFVLGEIREIIVIIKTIRRALYYYGKNGCNSVKTQATAHVGVHVQPQRQIVLRLNYIIKHWFGGKR